MRVMVYDATDTKPGIELGDTWELGGWLYRHLRRLDRCFGATSWFEAVEWLAQTSEVEGGLDEIQFWGHGSPGEVWINGHSLNVVNVDALAKVKMKPAGLFWLRTCASFAGEPGHLLARRMRDVLGCRVAGHTFNIGAWHGGLHSLRVGAEPAWSVSEGFGANGRPSFGTPWSPNTITFMHGRVPEDW